MLNAHQKRWGVEQWTAFLKEQDIPVMPRSHLILATMAQSEGDDISPKELAAVVTGDPFLALRLLRAAEHTRSHTLGHEVTTPLASVMQTGIDNLLSLVRHSPLCDDSILGLTECEFRAATASYIARAWASCRADVSPDEVALAALLADIGELMLWQFAAELPQAALEELHSGRAQRTLQAQTQAAGFTFKSLSVSLAEAWALPPLIAQLIRGVDNVRANIARLANDAARHVQADMDNPAIPDDIRAIRELLPHTSFKTLLAPLPISDDYRAAVLQQLDGAAA